MLPFQRFLARGLVDLRRIVQGDPYCFLLVCYRDLGHLAYGGRGRLPTLEGVHWVLPQVDVCPKAAFVMKLENHAVADLVYHRPR